MLSPQFVLPLAAELVIDLFAGGGGASTGIEQAIGRHVDIAVNHDPEAVSLHQANHPQTRHFVSDVFEVDPKAVCGDQPVGLLWASPDCKHFSKAKGGKPVSKKIRGLAWVVIKWAKQVQPRIICLENVEEFQTWGPLLENGLPCPQRKGKTFQHWVAQLRNLGYRVEWKELRACDFGAPTVRKRLFLIARRDGQPIVWPEKTHGPSLKPYRTAADCIDWSLPCPSIFERDRPLAPATMRRIAAGIKRYVIDAAKPFIVPVTHQGDNRVHSIDDPLRTVTSARRGEFALATTHITKFRQGSTGSACDEPLHTVTAGGQQARPGTGNAMGLVSATIERAPSFDEWFADTKSLGGSREEYERLYAPTLIQTGYGERPGQAPRVPGLDKPLGTCVDGQKHALVAAFMAQHNTDNVGHPVDRPLSTIVGKGCTQGLVTSHLTNFYTSNTGGGQGDLRQPIKTITAGGMHQAEVRAFLLKYYGTDQDPALADPLHTITTKDRFGLVTVKGEPYYIADIGLRMLQPRELYRAQGFPDNYIIDRGADGRVLPKASQVRMCGNSVCPPLARAIVAANYSERQALREAA